MYESSPLARLRWMRDPEMAAMIIDAGCDGWQRSKWHGVQIGTGHGPWATRASHGLLATAPGTVIQFAHYLDLLALLIGRATASTSVVVVGRPWVYTTAGSPGRVAEIDMPWRPTRLGLNDAEMTYVLALLLHSTLSILASTTIALAPYRLYTIDYSKLSRANWQLPLASLHSLSSTPSDSFLLLPFSSLPHLPSPYPARGPPPPRWLTPDPSACIYPDDDRHGDAVAAARRARTALAAPRTARHTRCGRGPARGRARRRH